MTELFQAAARNSLRGGVLILAVLVLRKLLRKTPRRVICLLWSLAALRLLVPVKLTAFFGLLPGQGRAVSILAGPADTVSAAASAVRAAGARGVDPLSALPWLWLSGTAGLLLWALVRALRLRRRLAGAVAAEDGVCSSERISTPFAFGLLRPRIYLPADLAEECRPWVLAHEQTHIRRWDTRRKALGFALLALYWFNPLCWLGWFAFCRDLELACDERVTAGLSFEDRKRYALALLRCSAPAGAFGGAAFGEKPVQARIRAVLYKRGQPRWLSAGIGAGCALLILCLSFEAPTAARSPAPAASAAAASAEPLSPTPAASPKEPAGPVSTTDASANFLPAGSPPLLIQADAIPEALLADDASRWEFSGPLSADGENGSYQSTVITNDPGARYSVQASSSADGQLRTITLRGVGGRSGALRMEQSAGEPEDPVSCSVCCTDDAGGVVYWEIRTSP